jgi:P27 family predicted phage terminase small subunit
MPRGRKPLPTKILKLRGSWRANGRDHEPDPEQGIPDCPDDLTDNGQAMWFTLTKMLNDCGVITKVDGNALGRYCHLWSRWRKLEQFIAENGVAYPRKDKEGHTTGLEQFPQVNMAGKIADQLLRLEHEFGLTPSARARIVTTGDLKNQDDMDKRMFG